MLPVILLVSLAAGCSPTPSGEAEPTDWSTLPGAVRIGDFPAVKDVSGAYPDLAGAKRWFISWEPIPIAADDRTCWGDWAVPLAAETGRLAVFDDRQGRQYEHGFPAPSIAVYGFATTAGAESAFEHLTGLFERCMGQREKEGARVVQKPIDLPSGLIGYRRVTKTPDGEGGFTDHRDVEFVLRKDNKLVRIWVQEFGVNPDVKQALTLVEPAKSAAGSAPLVKEKPAPGAKRIDRRTHPIAVVKKADLTKVPAIPAGLREQVGRDLVEASADDECPTAISLTVIRTDGFARGSRSRCEAPEGILYIRQGTTWKSVATDPTPSCATLERYRVPSSVAGDWCSVKDGDGGVDYPRS